MRISRGVIDQLAAGGIDTIFGIPGKQTLPLNEAIADRDEMRLLVARHETAVSHEAWGYAETSGDPAATVVVPGPGDMNALNGLKNAANDCTPLVHIAVETEPEVRGGNGIHETPPETYDPVLKENILVERPAGTRVEVQRAIETATTPPKGPVRIGIPKNFLGKTARLQVYRQIPQGPLSQKYPTKTFARQRRASKMHSVQSFSLVAVLGPRVQPRNYLQLPSLSTHHLLLPTKEKV